MEHTQLCKLSTFLFLLCLLVVAYCLLGDTVPSKTFLISCFWGQYYQGLYMYITFSAYVGSSNVLCTSVFMISEIN